MSVPLSTWINISTALSVIFRETQKQPDDDELQLKLLEALAEGSIRSQRRVDRMIESKNSGNGVFSATWELVTPFAELEPEFWRRSKTLSEAMVPPSQDLVWIFELHYPNLREWLLPIKTTGATRGRPTEIDWDDFWIEAALLADTVDSLPVKQAAFVAYMQDWYKKGTGRRCPSKTMIKEKAKLLYRMKKEKAGK